MTSTMNTLSTQSNQLFLPIAAALGWFVLSTVFVATTLLSPLVVSVS
jgi:hypothetical protein